MNLEYVLDRSEFVALAALMRADAIIGIDPAQLLPATPAERQAMFVTGEDSLIARKLARQTEAGQIQFESALLGIARALTQPQRVVIAIRAIPGRGQQLFLYYARYDARDGAWVEQTFPDSRTHRLAEVGSSDALLERLLEMFDFPLSVGDGQDFQMDTAGFVTLVSAVRAGEVPDAASVGATDPEALDSLVGAYAYGPVNGSIAMLPIREGRAMEALEIALARGQAESWMIAADGDSIGKARAFRADRESLSGALGAMLQALEQVGE
ncbi:MAG: hypothetical protein ABIQ99_12210 [Thermoflexales bacterium]